jgi:hypothetical protein
MLFSPSGEHCDDNKSFLAKRISLGLNGKNECGESIFYSSIWSRSAMERKELSKEVQEMSKDEDLDERPSDENELDRDRQASLASSSTARPMMRERKTCFKNI